MVSILDPRREKQIPGTNFSVFSRGKLNPSSETYYDEKQLFFKHLTGSSSWRRRPHWILTISNIFSFFSVLTESESSTCLVNQSCDHQAMQLHTKRACSFNDINTQAIELQKYHCKNQSTPDKCGSWTLVVSTFGITPQRSCRGSNAKCTP